MKNNNPNSSFSQNPNQSLSPSWFTSPSADYERFLQLFAQGMPDKKRVTLLKSGNSWPTPNGSDTGTIQNEIAGTFLNSKVFPNLNSQYSTRGNLEGSYSAERSGRRVTPQNYFAKLQLKDRPTPQGNSKLRGPDPRVVTHELVHANDHQIHNLNAKVWQYLSDLRNKLKSGKEFISSLEKIQDKIDPTGGFKRNYKLTKSEMKEELEKAYGEYWPSRHDSFATNKQNLNSIKKLFPEILQVVQHQLQIIPEKTPKTPKNVGARQAPSTTLANPVFFFSFASEFPAFMSERLTNNWNTGSNNPLSVDEARVLYNTLNDMDSAYSTQSAPITNQYIRARRNSIDAAYHNIFSQPSSSSSSLSSSSSSNNSILQNLGTGGPFPVSQSNSRKRKRTS